MDLIRRMIEISSLELEENIKEFDFLLEKLEKNENLILKFNELLKVFNDECVSFEVMFGLVHLLEKIPREVYVIKLIENINNSVSKVWLDILCNRIFNDEVSYNIFKKNINLADTNAIINLLDLMINESPHHISKIIELKNLLDKKIDK